MPQRRYGPPLLQGDRHAPESVIGLSELVIGIVGIRKYAVVDDPVAECLPRGVEVGAWEVVPILGKIVL